MKSFVAFVVCMVILLAVALNLHVIKTKTGLIYLGKASMTLKDTYVDISLWKPSDLKEHPELVAALKAEGHEGLVRFIQETQPEDGRMVSPWAAPAASPEAMETATQTQTGSGGTQKKIRDRLKKEVGR